MLFRKSFTPIGLLFGLVGWTVGGEVDTFWRRWGIGLAVVFLVVAGKLHHEYYWMAAAPLLAIGLARWLVAGWIGQLGDGKATARWFSFAIGVLFVLTSASATFSTFRTPDEWEKLPALAEALRREVPASERIIGSEALIQATGRQGFRLELAPAAQRRAAGEWGGEISEAVASDPSALVWFYRSRGARVVADLQSDDPRHAMLRERVRSGPVDRFLEVPGAGWIATLH